MNRLRALARQYAHSHIQHHDQKRREAAVHLVILLLHPPDPTATRRQVRAYEFARGELEAMLDTHRRAADRWRRRLDTRWLTTT